jgi:hypothetical protein
VSDLRHLKHDKWIVFTTSICVVLGKDASRFSLLYQNKGGFSKFVSTALPDAVGWRGRGGESYILFPERPTIEDFQG